MSKDWWYSINDYRLIMATLGKLMEKISDWDGDCDAKQIIRELNTRVEKGGSEG